MRGCNRCEQLIGFMCFWFFKWGCQSKRQGIAFKDILWWVRGNSAHACLLISFPSRYVLGGLLLAFENFILLSHA
jgi:hypothetical protein